MSCIHEPAGVCPPDAPWIATVLRLEPGGPRPLPLAGEAVHAGFPSPAEDYIEKTLDLNELLAPRPESTFFVRVAGDSMTGAAIHHGDILVVDRSLTPGPGNVVIACLHGEFTVKRLRKTPAGLELAPENPDYAAVALTPETDCEIWGVVRHVLHAL